MDDKFSTNVNSSTQRPENVNIDNNSEHSMNTMEKMSNPPSVDAEKASEATEAAELSGLKLTLVMVGLALAIFLMSLDTSIIATAIPKITSDFNSTADIGWYGSAYSFSLCALQPMAGRVFSNFSMKHAFLSFMAVFELGSLLCATAVNSPMLIVGRAIAGCGAAGCATGGFSIVASSLPLHKRSLYIGILQSTFGIATIIGPVLGGALTQHATWRLCFYINLPLGAITVAFIAFFFTTPKKTTTNTTPFLQRIASLDYLGLGLFIPSVIMVLLALQWGGTVHAWKSATTIGLLVGGFGLGMVFVLWQLRKGDDAMIPPNIFTHRNVFGACFAEFFAMGAVLTSIYYLPEWFQVIKGASPTKSGLMYLPLSLADILSAIVAGAALQAIGYPNIPILLGTVLMSIGTGLFTTFQPSTGHQHWIPYQVLQGMGAGMTLSMPYASIQTVLQPAEIPIGTSLVQCFQFLGGAVSLSIAQAVFSNKLVSSLMAAGISTQEIQSIIAAGAADVRKVTAPAQLAQVVGAYNQGIVETFYVAAATAVAAFVISLGLQWRSVKPSSS
jgi:EmrB/QacA subfamily drug resistance transporter